MKVAFVSGRQEGRERRTKRRVSLFSTDCRNKGEEERLGYVLCFSNDGSGDTRVNLNMC